MLAEVVKRIGEARALSCPSCADVSGSEAKAMLRQICADVSVSMAKTLPCQSSALRNKQAGSLRLRLAVS